MTNPLQLAVIYGSVRTARQGIKAARFIQNQCNHRGHTTTLLDPISHPLPLLDKMYKEFEPGQAPEELERIAKILRSADGYLIVSGEYNHSIPPALSNLLDHFQTEFFYKPSGIVCYSAGSFGGVRAAVALRPLLAELGMSSIPSVLPIPQVQSAFDEAGEPTDEKFLPRAEKFLKEFEWYAHALRDARYRDGKETSIKPSQPKGNEAHA
jgi:NAD(P)H-dependent FMN reductase